MSSTQRWLGPWGHLGDPRLPDTTMFVLVRSYSFLFLSLLQLIISKYGWRGSPSWLGVFPHWQNIRNENKKEERKTERPHPVESRAFVSPLPSAPPCPLPHFELPPAYPPHLFLPHLSKSKNSIWQSPHSLSDSWFKPLLTLAMSWAWKLLAEYKYLY